MIRSPLDQLERLVGIPARLRHVTAADEVHREQRVDAHRVVERHHAEGAVAVAVAVLQRLAQPAGPVGRVRARHALRPPGRARGVEEERDLAVVAVERAVMRGAVGQRIAVADHERRARHRRRSRRAPPPRAATRAARTRHPPTGRPSRGAPSRAGCRGRPRRARPARRRARRRSARPAAAARRSRIPGNASSSGCRSHASSSDCARFTGLGLRNASRHPRSRRRSARSRCSGRGGRRACRRSPRATAVRARAGRRRPSGCPGVQKPHWSAWWRLNASWSGESIASPASDSTVSTVEPSAWTASRQQPRTETPSRRTVHAPQTPCSQPTCVPVRPRRWRRKSVRSRRGSTSSTTTLPLTVTVISVTPPAPRRAAAPARRACR